MDSEEKAGVKNTVDEHRRPRDLLKRKHSEIDAPQETNAASGDYTREDKGEKTSATRVSESNTGGANENKATSSNDSKVESQTDNPENPGAASGTSYSASQAKPPKASEASMNDGKLTSQTDSRTSHHSGSTKSSGQGKQRKRARRRMNREARQRGEPLPYDNRRHRKRDHGSSDRHRENYYDSRHRAGPPREEHHRRGPPQQGWQQRPPERNEYDYSNYRTHSRSRSPRDDHERGRYRSSSRSRSSLSSSRSSSHERKRSKSNSKSKSSRDNRDSESRNHSRGGQDDKGSHKRSTSKSDQKQSTGSRNQTGNQNNPGTGRKRGSYKNRHRHGLHSRKRRTYHYYSYSDSSSTSSSSPDDSDEQVDDSAFSKDQRTVFVSQLVMRATEKEIRRYFKYKLGCKVREVILLRDKRTGNHKGSAYVQLGRIEDVNKAVAAAGQPPDFQRFPILVKASEAEKNYIIPMSSSTVTASMMGTNLTASPHFTKDGKLVEAQNVYVGGLDPIVSEKHLFAIFSQFGQLEKVSMQVDPMSNTRRGYAFLKFRDPKEANLAIQTMSQQMLAGRPMKTGWASQVATASGVEVVTSDELPPDSDERAKKAFAVLTQLMGSTEGSASKTNLSSTAEKALEAAMGGEDDLLTASGAAIPTVADARASSISQREEATNVATAGRTVASVSSSTTEKSALIGGLAKPSKFILVFNMYDKDEETEDGWEKDLEDEFREECSKFGTINSVVVMSKEPGGKMYAAFETVEGAEECAKNLAGRWFDKRQLRVDYVEESDLPDVQMR